VDLSLVIQRVNKNLIIVMASLHFYYISVDIYFWKKCFSFLYIYIYISQSYWKDVRGRKLLSHT